MNVLLPINSQGDKCDEVLEALRSKLPISPPLYPADTLTDRPEKFFASEIIRENIFKLYGKEIPYSCEVVIRSFKDSPKILKIEAAVVVSRESQRPIIVGKSGLGVKRLGTQSRETLENFFGKKIFLDLQVTVSKNWRTSSSALRDFGYSE